MGEAVKSIFRQREVEKIYTLRSVGTHFRTYTSLVEISGDKTIVISDKEIGSPVSYNLEDLIVMNGPSLHKFLPNLKSGGNLFINSTIVSDIIERNDINVIEAPVTQMAIDIGNERALNIIMLGVYVAATEAVPEDVVIKGIEHKFASKEHLIKPNIDAFKMGLDIGRKYNK
jgi:2-oxoglutarate ferredoxin oxidoreductase subunit gamma